MKTALTILVFLFSFTLPEHTFAQPGDPYLKIQLRYFHEIQDSILEYPDNLFYKWVRVDILFNPIFDLHTKPTSKLREYLSNSPQFKLYIQDSIIHSSRPHYMSSELIVTKTYNPSKVLGDFLLKNQKELIEDLTDLIEADEKFINRFMNSIGQYNGTANKSSFQYKRGQLHYLSGNPEKGLKDFMSAIENSQNKELNKKIYASIAAYYYNLDVSERKENYSLALKYIKLVEPAIEDYSYCKGGMPGDYHYEREKLDLMERYNDSTSYVTYLQNRTISYLNYYYSIVESTDNNDREYYMTNAYERSREYELMIYKYLIGLNPKAGAEEFKKHKKLIIEKI